MQRRRVRILALLATTAVVSVALLAAALFNRAPFALVGADSRGSHSIRDGSSRGIDEPSVARLIAEKYGLQVVSRNQEYPVKTWHGLIQAANATNSELDLYAPILANEFPIYPPSFIRRSRLKRIVLCRGLSFAGQNRAAIPDFEHDTLYLDVVSGDYDRKYQSHVIHHEFFHIIDYQDDGQVYSDERWATLNAGTFRYGTGGANMQSDRLSGLPSDLPGFLTPYATSGVEEDKAEIFAHMVMEYAVVWKRAANDRIVGEKISAMKGLLRTFCPEIDETFWDDIKRRQAISR